MSTSVTSRAKKVSPPPRSPPIRTVRHCLGSLPAPSGSMINLPGLRREVDGEPMHTASFRTVAGTGQFLEFCQNVAGHERPEFLPDVGIGEAIILIGRVSEPDLVDIVPLARNKGMHHPVVTAHRDHLLAGLLTFAVTEKALLTAGNCSSHYSRSQQYRKCHTNRCPDRHSRQRRLFDHDRRGVDDIAEGPPIAVPRLEPTILAANPVNHGSTVVVPRVVVKRIAIQSEQIGCT